MGFFTGGGHSELGGLGLRLLRLLLRLVFVLLLLVFAEAAIDHDADEHCGEYRELGEEELGEMEDLEEELVHDGRD